MRVIKPEVLESRKKYTLQAVIYHYINTAKPVSSKAIVDEFDLSLSPASIRKILYELEKENFLTHPYTSSGRIPTDKAYRWFVDKIVELQNLAAKERARIIKEYKTQIRELDELFVKTSHLLAVVSNYAGFIISPKLDRDKIQSIQLIKISEDKLLATIITDLGFVKHYTLSLDMPISDRLLSEISEILNERFQYKSLSEFKSRILEIIDEIHAHQTKLQKLLQLLSNNLFQEEEKLYLEGASNIFLSADKKEFKSLITILKSLEQKQSLINLLKEELDKIKGIKVTIGKENQLPELKELTMIKTVYKLNELPVGVLGIIGPKRMQYSKMISLVDFISSTLNKTIATVCKQNDRRNQRNKSN